MSGSIAFNFSTFLVRILQYHDVILSMSHQCKVNGDFMQEVRSNELDSDANFKMLHGIECTADVYCFLTQCQQSIFVNKMKLRLCSIVNTHVKQ